MSWSTKSQKLAKAFEPKFKLKCGKCQKLFLAKAQQASPKCPDCRGVTKKD